MFCPLVRWQLSGALDRDAERPRLAAAHIARCPRCSAFAARLDALHRRLGAGALEAPMPSSIARRPAWRPLRATAALVLAGAAAAALYFMVAHNGEVRVARDDSVLERAEPVPVAPIERSVPESSPTRDIFGRLSVLFTEPSPLRTEVNAIASDSRRAALAILSLGGVRL